MTSKESFLYSLLTVSVLLLLSLGSAWILFHYLDSFAFIDNKKILLGGAAAGFIIILHTLYKIFYKFLYSGIDLTNKSNQKKIQVLENKINDLLFDNFNKIETPKDFIRQIDYENKLTFCYPDYYEMSTFSTDIILFGLSKLTIEINSRLEIDNSPYCSISLFVIKNIDMSINYEDFLDYLSTSSEKNAYFADVKNLKLIQSINLQKNGHDVKDLMFTGIDGNGFEVKIISKTIRISDDKVCSIVFQSAVDVFDCMYGDFETMFNTFEFVYVKKEDNQS